MRPPPFWYDRRGALAYLLSPAGYLYAAAGAWRLRQATPFRCGLPVLCVGNVTAGGTGKTPITIDLAQRLSDRGQSPHILVRGYGGRTKGPYRVDPSRDDARTVGDEALLLARTAPTWVGGDRAASARLASQAGATVIVMDDGFQNPGLHQDCAVLVVDATSGIGNGLPIPAGPMRESWDRAAKRAQAAVVMEPPTVQTGDDATLRVRHPDLSAIDGPVLKARLVPDPALIAALSAEQRGRPVVAFAGIGRPHKFFDSLRSAGFDLAEAVPFPDHHPYKPGDLKTLSDLADHFDAPLWTTEKDLIRLPPSFRTRVTPLPVSIAWSDPHMVNQLLDDLLGGTKDRAADASKGGRA